MFGKNKKSGKGGAARSLNIERAFSTSVAPKPGPAARPKTWRPPRENCWYTCTIRLAGGGSMEGIMVDRTDQGARIRFVSHSRLSDTVILRVPRLGWQRKAQVVWQTRGDAGLRFL